MQQELYILADVNVTLLKSINKHPDKYIDRMHNQPPIMFY